MRKILSLLLSLLIGFSVLPIFGTAVNAEEVEITPEQTKVLSLIGMGENEFEETALSRNLTRSQFIQYAAYAIGISEKNCTDREYYTDIDGYNTAGIINTFAELGILSVGETKEFEPDRIITSDEVLKIVISLLGYNTVAEYNGGFPQGYRTQANKLDLPVFFSSETLTAAQCFSLLAEALETPIYDITEISADGKVKFSKEDDKTLLSVYHSINTEEGYVRAVNTISLDDSVCDKGEMIIGDKRYNAENLGCLEDYLGLYSKVYYKDENNGGRYNAVLIIPDSENDTVVINADDVDELDSDYVLKAWNEKSNTYKKYNIERNVIVIKNGCKEKSEIRDVINNLNYGTLKLIKSTNGGYDCIIIKDYIPVSVSSISYEKDEIFDGLTNQRINIYDYDYVSMLDEDKNSIDISAINREDILNIAIGSEPNKYIEIVKSLKSVSGTVDSLEKSDDDTFCVINSLKYKVCKEYLKKNKISVGMNGMFKLDIFGNIADVSEQISSGKKLGLLIGTSLDDTFNSSLKLKIFDSTGKIQVYNVSDNVTIDEIRYKDMQKAADLLKNTANVQVIQYSVNSDSGINNIDTSNVSEKENADKTLRVEKPKTNSFVAYEKISSGSISRRLASNMFFNANTIIFGIPSEEKLNNNDYTDDDFIIVPFADLKYGIELDGNTKGYYLSRETPYVSALTVNNAYVSTKSSFTGHMYVLSDISERLDDENISRKYYTFYNSYDRKKYEYYLSDDVDTNADIGDTVILNTDTKGCIQEISMLYDASEGGEPMTQSNGITWKSNAYSNGSFNVVFMYAGYVAGNVIHGTFNRGGTAFDDNAAIDTNVHQPIIIDSSVKNKNEIVRIGDERDVKDMNSVNINDASKILLAFKGLDVTGVIVYN